MTAPTHPRATGPAGTITVITGASTGIGEATARHLAAAGGRVVVVARRADRLRALVEDIDAEGGAAVAVPGDVVDPTTSTRMVACALAEFGGLDFAVNNAGVPGRGAFLDLPLADIDHTMEVNYRAVVLAMRAEIPAMIERGGGAIVNVASVSGLLGTAGLAPYAASKHALIGLTRSTAREFAPRGVRINAVAPGVTETDMFTAATPAHRELLLSGSASGRVADPAEVARAIAFLLADATATVGATLPVDGGRTA